VGHPQSESFETESSIGEKNFERMNRIEVLIGDRCMPPQENGRLARLLLLERIGGAEGDRTPDLMTASLIRAFRLSSCQFLPVLIR
jgi:hypothetical protein